VRPQRQRKLARMNVAVAAPSILFQQHCMVLIKNAKDSDNNYIRKFVFSNSLVYHTAFRTLSKIFDSAHIVYARFSREILLSFVNIFDKVVDEI